MLNSLPAFNKTNVLFIYFSGDVSVDDMDKCIQSGIDPACDAIIAHWKGSKQKFSFLCKWRNGK